MTASGTALLAADGPIAQLLPHYEVRQAQLQMSAAVDAFVQQPDRVLLVEAGTGVGKSLAYLAPALCSGRACIVATGTKALQDQLAHDDVPLLVRALRSQGLPAPRIEVVKGRRNYLCWLRLERLLDAPALPGLDVQQRLQSIEAWAHASETGDRAELEDLPDNFTTWDEIDAGADTCEGSRCPYREDCFIVHLRERSRTADLIITNHHLLMADEALRLQQRFGDVPDAVQLLPSSPVLIVDEAHALHDVATEAFSAGVSTGNMERLCRDVIKALTDTQAPARASLQQLSHSVEIDVSAVVTLLAQSLSNEQRPNAQMLDEQQQQRVEHALTQLRTFTDLLQQRAVDESAFEPLALRAERILRALQFVARNDDPSYVYYSQTLRRGSKLLAAPIDISRPLNETLLRSGRQVLLTSATLCTDQGFANTRQLLGLAHVDNVDELCLPSPFPYAERVRLYLPQDPIQPDSAAHLERLSQEIMQLCQAARGGAFLLFTSYRVLDEIFARVGPQLDLTLLRQGDAPRRVLIERFRADGNAVLFGTHSFWEGVDVRGHALRLVVIDRLPFMSPQDPLHAARCRLLEGNGGKPFFELSLPQAILALKQGVGRLMRASDDGGVIALLDGRLVSKGYGKRFLRALPSMPQVRKLDAVADFFETFEATPSPAK